MTARVMSTWSRASGRRLAVVAAGWAVLDLLLHLATDQLEAPRVAGNVIAVAAALTAVALGGYRAAALVCWAGAAVHTALAVSWVVVTGGVQPAAVVLLTVGIGLLVAAGSRLRRAPGEGAGSRTRRRLVTAASVVTTLALCVAAGVQVFLGSSAAQLYDGQLEAADYFTPQPLILSAGLGFDGTIGVGSLDEETVRAAGGAWARDLDCAPAAEVAPTQRTSAVATDGIDSGFVVRDDSEITGSDGLPVVFSWPVRSDTVHPDQFRLTLSNGDVVRPEAAGLLPNFERNERQTVVLVGDLGTRGTGPGALAPVRLDIDAADGRALLLAGPDGDVEATGLSLDIGATGYVSGPTLVAAKLTRVDPDVPGEGGAFGATAAAMPNDEVALYGDRAEYRIRMLTTGGFSPDGVLALRPSDFADHFRLRATGADGSDVELTQSGVDYEVAGGTVRVLGLADLGRRPGEDVPEDECYQEDGDNQVDVVLAGDQAAVASITHVEMPGLPGGYAPLFNPGGPGPEPFEGVDYTEPSPPLVLPVTVALDDPMQVTRE